MARLPIVTPQIFGSTAPNTSGNQIGKVGSLAAGSTVTYAGSTLLGSGADVAALMSLSNYLAGLGSIVVGSNSPALQDLNGLHFLHSFFINYFKQMGIAEYDSGMTYYIGSIVQDGSGNIYTSLTNSNTGNALSSTVNWRLLIGNAAGAVTRTTYSSGSGTYTPPSGVRSLFVKIWGGGGGGGGTGFDSSAGYVSIGGGGGGGDYVEGVITTISSSYTYSVGGGGAGGTAGASSGASGSNGVAGSNTTFGTWIAGGGSSGGGGDVLNAVGIYANGGAPGPNGSSTGGNIIFPGCGGASGSTTVYVSGQTGIINNNSGGSAFGFSMFNPIELVLNNYFGISPTSALSNNYNIAGANAIFVGQGGPGGINYQSGVAQPGGNGHAGLIIIDEYY